MQPAVITSTSNTPDASAIKENQIGLFRTEFVLQNGIGGSSCGTAPVLIQKLFRSQTNPVPDPFIAELAAVKQLKAGSIVRAGLH